MAHGDYSRELQRLEERRRRQMRERVTKALIITAVVIVGISGVTLIVYARYPELFIR